MKNLSAIAFGLAFSLSANAQECPCPSGAPEGGEVLNTWQFGGGNTLAACGFRTMEEGDTSYTKFVLYRCGEDKVVKSWTVNTSCKAERTKDALLIKEMYNLPVGGNFSTLWRPFFVHQYSFRNGVLQHSVYYDKHLPHYNKDQIASVLRQYKELSPEPTQSAIKVANMLFWAAVSGSSEARELFKTMPDKFGPFTGVLGEEWDDINTRYMQWLDMKN